MHRRTAATDLPPRSRPAARKEPRSSGRLGGRFPGSSQNPLTHKQKGIICKVARRAFDQLGLGKVGVGVGTLALILWRREQQLAAVGKDSLTACTQDDYLPLVAHFEGLAGEGGHQFNAAFRHLDEAVRQQRHLLDAALAARGLDTAYAEKICRDANRGKSLAEANARQLECVKFTIEARRPILAEVPADMPF